MPDYSSLSTQIEAAKSELTSLFASGQLTAQDMVFVASTLDKLGTMLGVNDLVAATADGVTTLTNTKNSGVTTLNNTRDSAIATINSTYLHPLFLIGV